MPWEDLCPWALSRSVPMGPEWAQLSRVCAETQGGADTLEGQRALWPVCGVCVCVCIVCVRVFAGNIPVLRQQTA